MNYLDGSHITENLGYLVIEAGIYESDYIYWEAGKIENVNHEWKTVEYEYQSFLGLQAVPSTPLLLLKFAIIDSGSQFSESFIIYYSLHTQNVRKKSSFL